MIDMNELEWGLRPFPQVDVIAAYGARTIFENGEIDIVHDRQSLLGGASQKKILWEWVHKIALPKLREHIKNNGWTSSSNETFTYENWRFKFEASPRRSYGYIYFTAYLRGLDHFPEVDGVTVKWSGQFVPKVGDIVYHNANGIGKVMVLGFCVTDGWVDAIVKPEDPPTWYIEQNGENAICGVAGVALSPLEPNS